MKNLQTSRLFRDEVYEKLAVTPKEKERIALAKRQEVRRKANKRIRRLIKADLYNQ